MACYNVFADLSWSDFTEAQQLDSANPPSFVDHLTNANFLNDPFLIDFPDLALPLNFHQGFFQVSDSPRTLSKLEENTSMATSHESITVEDRQIPNLGEVGTQFWHLNSYYLLSDPFKEARAQSAHGSLATHIQGKAIGPRRWSQITSLG